MSGFSEDTFDKKLADLNNSQQSIQQLSLWIIHHRKHYETVVRVWLRELGKAATGRKLTFLYLANDVVQNSKKKAPEFAKEFGGIMKKVLDHLAAVKLDEKTVKSIARLLNIWQERSIFEAKIQTELSRTWTKKTLEMADDEPKTPPQPPPKKAKKVEKSVVKKVEKPTVVVEKSVKNKNGSLEGNPEFQKILSSEANASPADPPEPEELIKALQDLENSASVDAVVREKIARLPPEVSETVHLDKLQSEEDGQKLLQKVNQATKLLTEYNARLEQELKDRKRVGKMISDFLAAQNDLLAQAEERLEMYRDKLDKVNAIRDDLQSHIQSLPDLTKLPDVTGGLAPLPSAGDLFMK